MCTWNPDTPVREPCGALMSAGSSGKVLILLHTVDETDQQMLPAKSIQSPELTKHLTTKEPPSSNSIASAITENL